MKEDIITEILYVLLILLASYAIYTLYSFNRSQDDMNEYFKVWLPQQCAAGCKQCKE